MIYITGDTHGDFQRFSTKRFPEQKEMTRTDFVIVCGDFGGVWDSGESSPEETYYLDWLSEKPFTLLFVDGNHENFDRLNQYPVVDYKCGKAHKIRKNIYHLMRGNVFEIDGKRLFAFGGARSHDIKDGILDANDYSSYRELIKDYKNRISRGEMIRINNVSWWKEELPDSVEMCNGFSSLQNVGGNVDYVITHCLPQSIVACLLGQTESDILTKYFQYLIDSNSINFNQWYCGHYHTEERLLGKYNILYKNIIRVN